MLKLAGKKGDGQSGGDLPVISYKELAQHRLQMVADVERGGDLRPT